MCGINGIFHFSNSVENVSEDLLIRMRDIMAHRGPDGFGAWISDDRKVGLGHRRLSIIDPSELASQPMSNFDQTVIISFNGEIYNHAELRKELDLTGNYRWLTDHSDTEVILNSFQEWGISCVNKFRGMFAIAIWDEKNQKLWLVRDRMGVKPLYYTVLKDKILFASEIKSILESKEVERSLCEESLFNYLTYLYVPAPLTLFEGVKKVSNATFLCVEKNGNITEHRYWDALDYLSQNENDDEAELKIKLINNLRDSVKIRTISDVPVGVFLSGGIDSSANATLFSQVSNDVNTFSIAYDKNYESSRSELDYAKKLAKTIGATYHEKLLSENDLIDILPLIVYLQDEPIADPVCVPVYYVSKLARDNGKIVCHVGEGADELFCGYDSWIARYKAQLILDKLPISVNLKKYLVSFLEFIGLGGNWKKEYIKRNSLGFPIFWGGSGGYTDYDKYKILNSRLKNKFSKTSSWSAISAIRKRFLVKYDGKEHLKWMSYLDLNSRLPELLLMRVDKMSMGASIECRVPFLDQDFVHFSMSVSSNFKIKGNIGKYLLKKALHGIIPDEIINRKKQGFSAPVNEWLDGKLGKIIELEVKYFCEKTDYFDWGNVKMILNKRNEYLSWQLLNLALWWRIYIEGGTTNKDVKLLFEK